MNKDISAYNRVKGKSWKAICSRLAKEIDAGLSKAERKIWHGSPIWFLDGNPVVGYGVLKTCVRLLFSAVSLSRSPASRQRAVSRLRRSGT